MGMILDIQRFCYHDGPGIRTSVFLKGCSLRCAWCHNPEAFRPEPELLFDKAKCVFCGACVSVCPGKAHRVSLSSHLIDRTKCVACGACVSACPENALSIAGKEMSAEEVLSVVLKDLPYYRESGGGVTFTGGEPSCQPEFLLELAKVSKDKGLHTAVETNGFIPEETLDRLLPLTDLFLIDYKLDTGDEYIRYCLAPPVPEDGSAFLSEDTLSRTDFPEKLERTLLRLDSAGKPVWLRLPVIPGVNDTRDHFREAAAFAGRHPSVVHTEIMPYHDFGAAKWHALGLTYAFDGQSSASPEAVSSWKRLLKEFQP